MRLTEKKEFYARVSIYCVVHSIYDFICRHACVHVYDSMYVCDCVRLCIFYTVPEGRSSLTSRGDLHGNSLVGTFKPLISPPQ